MVAFASNLVWALLDDCPEDENAFALSSAPSVVDQQAVVLHHKHRG